MKDSLIQKNIFTYELGRSTNMILNTDENPLVTLYDMFYFYCMYISTWTVKRAILVEGWSESAFEVWAVPTSLLLQAKVFGDDIRANVLKDDI